MHIAVTGNIGAGKTTLAQLLAQHYHWDVLYEAVEGNPYLEDFYGDMARWSFNLQIYFLNSRFDQVKYIHDVFNKEGAGPREAGPRQAGSRQAGSRQAGSRQAARTIVQDRTIYEDAFIFARNLRESGTMSERDYQTYRRLFDSMLSLVRPPDLMIYLRADIPKLTEQIQKRGRSYEQSISEAYLASLNRLYEEFATQYSAGKLLVVDVNELDYANRPDDFQSVIRQIDALLAELPIPG